MIQLRRYFISRIAGPGVVTVALDQGGKGSADIRCGESGETGEPRRARYAVDLAGREPMSASREDLLFQVCRRAISQLQQEARAFRSGDRCGVLNLAIAPWNGDLYETPPLSTIGPAPHMNAGRPAP